MTWNKVWNCVTILLIYLYSLRRHELCIVFKKQQDGIQRSIIYLITMFYVSILELNNLTDILIDTPLYKLSILLSVYGVLDTYRRQSSTPLYMRWSQLPNHRACRLLNNPLPNKPENLLSGRDMCPLPDYFWNLHPNLVALNRTLLFESFHCQGVKDFSRTTYVMIHY